RSNRANASSTWRQPSASPSPGPTSMRRVSVSWCAKVRPLPSSRRETDRLFRLDVGGLDHLGPFLGIADKMLFKLGRRPFEHIAAEVGDPHAQRGVGKPGIDF